MSDQEYLDSRNSLKSQISELRLQYHSEKSRLQTEMWNLKSAFTKDWTVVDFWEFRDRNGGQDP